MIFILFFAYDAPKFWHHFFILKEKSKMNCKTKKLTTMAMLCALGYVLSVLVHISIVPTAPFLTYDPKDVIITIGGFIFGPLSALVMSVVVSLLEIFTIGDTGPIGFIMDVLSTCSFACIASFIYKKKHSFLGAVTGLLCGSILMTIAMLIWNYLITPWYMGVPREEVVKMLVPVFLVFNLIKAGLNSGFAFMLYKPVISALRAAGIVEKTNIKINKKSVGVYILFGIILVTCVLVILSLKGII